MPQRTHTRTGFTLVELLVVIAIIVILLALLVGGLEKALKAAERSKCGTNQRSIAQASAAYALEYDRTFPTAKTIPGGVAAYNSFVVRTTPGTMAQTTAPFTESESKQLAVGAGHLVAQGRVGGTTKGGEAVHCPTLDTTSSVPVKFGMDEAGMSYEDNPMQMPIASPDPTVVGNQNLILPSGSVTAAAGASFWNTAAQNPAKIVGGYQYRGLSYQNTHSGGSIRTNIAKATFVITSDGISMTTSNADPTLALRVGRLYHHIDGWNVSYGDGHVSYVKDENGPARVVDTTTGRTNGFVEEKVVGDNVKYPSGTAAPNDLKNAKINGVTKPGADEAVFKYLGGR